NTIRELQNYTVGLASNGLALAPDGSLDVQKSFIRVNYFSLVCKAKVRNNVQPGVESRPVDLVAVRLPAEGLSDAAGKEFRANEAIWLYHGEDKQALILARFERSGELLLRYVPVANLRQGADGAIHYERAKWQAGLPLKLWEDAKLIVPANEPREDWLDRWHSDLEWLRALHLTTYSNGLIGLHEQFGRHTTPAIEADVPGLSLDEQLIRRFRRRQRLLVEPDLLILANNHWNFDVRGFNPGGNHGSFFRVSTRSTLMLAGGERTRIPRALVIREPYDSLSFVPTILALTDQLSPDAQISPVKFDAGPRPFPGRIINELFTPTGRPARPSTNTVGTNSKAKAEVSP
ncbi:MAG: hypothetical protein LC747_09240, partial [Acidobacteria bacterium]|nr:hypothetical protein [Acidobacteriota bacterium]